MAKAAHRQRGRNILLLLVGLLLWGGAAYLGGFDQVSKLTHLDPFYLLLACLVVGIMVYIYAVRWGTIVNTLVGGVAARPFDYFFYSLSANMMGLIGPKTLSIVAVRSSALVGLAKLSVKKTAASLAIDKLFDGILMLMFIWLLIPVLLDLIPLAYVLPAALLEFFLISSIFYWQYERGVAFLRRGMRLFFRLLQVLPLLKKAAQSKTAQQLQSDDLWNLMSRRNMGRAYMLSALGQLSLAIRSWLIALAIGLDISFPLVFIGVAVAQGSLLLAVTPGALGILESAWFLTFTTAGVPNAEITPFILAHRIINSMALLIIWLLTYIYGVLSHRLQQIGSEAATSELPESHIKDE